MILILSHDNDKGCILLNHIYYFRTKYWTFSIAKVLVILILILLYLHVTSVSSEKKKGSKVLQFFKQVGFSTNSLLSQPVNDQPWTLEDWVATGMRSLPLLYLIRFDGKITPSWETRCSSIDEFPEPWKTLKDPILFIGNWAYKKTNKPTAPVTTATGHFSCQSLDQTQFLSWNGKWNRVMVMVSLPLVRRFFCLTHGKTVPEKKGRLVCLVRTWSTEHRLGKIWNQKCKNRTPRSLFQ